MLEVGNYIIRGTFEDYSRPYTKEFSGSFTTTPTQRTNGLYLEGELLDSDGKDSDISGYTIEEDGKHRIEFWKYYRYSEKLIAIHPKFAIRRHHVMYDLEFRPEGEGGLWVGTYTLFQHGSVTKSHPDWVKCQIFPSISNHQLL